MSRAAAAAASTAASETAGPAVLAPVYVAAQDSVEFNQMGRWLDGQSGSLALDTEFTSFPSYEPVLELVQIAGSDGVASCIDCASINPAKVADLLIVLQPPLHR